MDPSVEADRGRFTRSRVFMAVVDKGKGKVRVKSKHSFEGTKWNLWHHPHQYPPVQAWDDTVKKVKASQTLANSCVYSLQGPKQLEQQTLKKSSQEYDKQLLSKIGNPNTPPRTFRPSNLGNLARPDSPNSYPQLASGNQCGQLRTHSLPDGTAVSAADNALYQWSNGSKSAAVSPGIAPSAFPPQSYMDARGSGLPSSNDSDRFSRLRNSESGWSGCSSIFSHSDDASSLTSRSNRGSYDQSTYMESDQDFPEEAAMKHLNLRDLTPPGSEGRSPSSKAGMKRRRGSSPNREPAREERSSIVSMGSVGDPYSQRSSGHLLASRDSPVLRFPPGHGSISSNSSIGARNSSYASSAGLSVAASSITSISSFDRLSPGGISPSSEMDLGHDLPYAAASSLNPSPRSSLSHARHQRTLSESKHPSEIKMSNDSLCHAKHHSAPRLQGLFICECCPKKPKRFDSQEEKALHEMEKQYTCQYCHNRFKNKNEAERHQNSLHLRRHSWSCAALSGVDAAFHPSSSNPAAADVCGYCGDEFAAPANWDVRVEHLTSVHKFGECNQSKKFFRADHFRQHLKHSHAGTSGKWTNMLENACMKDEPPPERINSGGEGKRRGSGGDGDGGGGGGILAPPGSSGGGGERGGDVRGHVIDEVHEES
ncbi:MAG: hypothetical protein M1819_006543 [Sarea resinae]|nr:MAG: hypothetical protein M1819_006543 [Sarea resinae]